MTNIAGSASASGSRSISQRHRSADPDPDPDPDPLQNVMDPQHWLKHIVYSFLCTNFRHIDSNNVFVIASFFVCSFKISEGERQKNKFSTPEMKKSGGGFAGRSVFGGNIPANQWYNKRCKRKSHR
jgi:hypothetical protein